MACAAAESTASVPRERSGVVVKLPRRAHHQAHDGFIAQLKAESKLRLGVIKKKKRRSTEAGPSWGSYDYCITRIEGGGVRIHPKNARRSGRHGVQYVAQCVACAALMLDVWQQIANLSLELRLAAFSMLEYREGKRIGYESANWT